MRHAFRYCVAILAISCFSIGHVWGATTPPADTVTVHTPGGVADGDLVTKWGKKYEVYFSNNASKTSMLVGSNASSTTQATGTNKWCNIGSSCGSNNNNISTAFTVGEFVSNVKTSNNNTIRVQSLARSERNIVMVVSGYDSIAVFAKSNDITVYKEEYSAGSYGAQSALTLGHTANGSSHYKRSFALDNTKRYRLTIAYGESGSTNKDIVAFSLCYTPLTWKFKCDNDSWTEHTMSVSAGVASYSAALPADSRIEFCFDDNGTVYKNQGTIITTTSGWTFNTSDNNCKIHTGPAGTYTFAINTTSKAVTVTYPTVEHPNAHYVYFKNTNSWGTVKGYLGNTGNDNKAAAWPGSDMQATTTICGDTYYYAALNAMSGIYNVIVFNNGSGSQTSDLSTTGSLGKYNANTDATWHEFPTYTISFNNGGGSGSMSSITNIPCGADRAITANSFTKTDYTFSHWTANVAVTVGGATVAADQAIANNATIQNIGSDITLTANWSSGAPIPGTLDKANHSAVSDNTWWTTNTNYYDFKGGSGNYTSRYIEWEVSVAITGDYLISEEYYCGTEGQGWEFKLFDTSHNLLDTYNTGSLERLQNTYATASIGKWHLPAGNYIIRVRNVREWAEPKIKSITFTYDGEILPVIPVVPADPSGTSRTYTADNTTIFPNPERGFLDQLEMKTSERTYCVKGRTWYFSEAGSNRENDNERLVLLLYYLDSYKTNPTLPSSLLDAFDEDMQTLRSVGYKCILRYAYSQDDNVDAAKSIVLSHISQLASHWAANKDVIYAFQAGFIGRWGEWYYTSNFDNTNSHMTADRAEVVTALVNALPSDVFILLRTPLFKTEYLNDATPLTYYEAYTGTPKARFGHHNDAYLYGAQNQGTYNDTASQKPYLARETFYVPIGGETNIENEPEISQYATAAKAQAETSRLHWSFCKGGWPENTMAAWKADGTYDEFLKKLGYRYQLVNGTYTNASTVGGTMKVYMNIRNVGYAPLYNERHAYIILTNASNTYSIQMETDPRRWRPNGVVTEIGEELDLPDGIVPGTYNLYLALPDNHSSLASDVRYAIRFANTGVWDSTHGWNNLNATITVSAGSTPTLTVSPTSVNFGDKTINTTHTNTITVSGSNLSANATVSSNNAALTVSPATITPAQASSGQTVTLSLTPTATGSGSATVTIASSGATTKTVTVTWNGVAAPSVVDLPGTVNKGNRSAVSADTWWTTDNDYYDFGSTHAPSSRSIEWQVNLTTAGIYTVTEEFGTEWYEEAPDPGFWLGHQWYIELLDGGSLVSDYTSTAVWDETGTRTDALTWDLSGVTPKVYTLRVTNPVDGAKPKLKSLTLSIPVVSTYTVSYNAGSGAGITGSHANDTKTHDVALTLPGVVFSRTGYTQTGWTTSNGGAQTHALGGSYTTNADQIFYPVWTANNYDLTWNLGGGTTTSAGTGIASGVSVNTTSSVAYGTSLTAPTVTKTGYNFDAWSPSVASTMPATATTYTATWTVKTTTITINANTANHGNTTPGTVTATWGSVLPSFVAASGTSGYTLRGYYTAPTGGTKVINVDGTLVRNTTYATDESTPKWKYEIATLTLYPQYDEPTYVVFDNNNGTGNHNWSVATNWQGGALPSASQTARIIEPCIVNVNTAVAKNVLIATGTYNGHLTIAPTGGLVVTQKIQKAVNGNYASPTAITASDLTIEASSSGQGALVLGTEDGTAQATVQMYSKAYIDTHKHWQYMGIPFSNTPEAQSLFSGGYMYRWDETTAAGWNTVSNATTLQPFVGYCLSQPAAKTYEWTGTLCASSNRNLTVSYTSAAQAGANLFSNSWTAPLEIAKFEDGDFSNAGIEKTIYIFNTGSRAEYDAIGGEANTGSSPGQFFAIPVHAAPYAVGLPTVIPPMQGFQIMTTIAGTLTLNYARLTAPYGAGLNTQPLKAPKSEEVPDVLRLTVYGQSGQSSSDRFYLLTRSDCSENFDNGWDGKKQRYYQDLVALYSVGAGGDMAVDTRSQMAGTNLTFAAGVDSAYTMEFYYTGMQTLYLFDQEANTYTQLTDGAIYTFDAVPYATSTRFRIVAEKGSTTDFGEVQGDNVQCTKVIIDGHLYILRGERIYDATGKRQ